MATLSGGAFGEDGRFMVGPAAAGVVVEVWLGDSFPLRLPIERVRISLETDPTPDGTVRVNLGGVVPTETFIAGFELVAGSLSEAFCSETVFESVASQIRAASDIMADGTQDPGSVCDGISIGLGFEMALADICGVGPNASPLVDLCE